MNKEWRPVGCVPAQSMLLENAGLRDHFEHLVHCWLILKSVACSMPQRLTQSAGKMIPERHVNLGGLKV